LLSGLFRCSLSLYYMIIATLRYGGLLTARKAANLGSLEEQTAQTCQPQRHDQRHQSQHEQTASTSVDGICRRLSFDNDWPRVTRQALALIELPVAAECCALSQNASSCQTCRSDGQLHVISFAPSLFLFRSCLSKSFPGRAFVHFQLAAAEFWWNFGTRLDCLIVYVST
jgi:hypothetical protein